MKCSSTPPGASPGTPGTSPGTPCTPPGTSPGTSPAGADVHDRLGRLFRAHSLETELYLHAVADRLDMTTADLVCMTLLHLEGPCNPGWLADRTGLSSGAITGVLDRLSAEGRIRREVDPLDRRRLVVRPLAERVGDLVGVLDPMLADARRLHERFRPDELETVERFIDAARQMLARHTVALRQGEGQALGLDGAVVSVPRGATTDAVLHLAGLSSSFRIEAADLGGELCRVDLGGPTPSVRASPGRVLVQLRGRSRNVERGELLLHGAVRWRIELSGGARRLDVDMSSGRIAGLTLRGSVRQLALDLPAPEEVVVVSISGAAGAVVLRRPVGSPVAVSVRGGAGEVILDGSRVRRVAGTTRIASQMAHQSGAPGYEVELHGGAERLEIEVRPRGSETSRDRRS